MEEYINYLRAGRMCTLCKCRITVYRGEYLGDTGQLNIHDTSVIGCTHTGEFEVGHFIILPRQSCKYYFQPKLHMLDFISDLDIFVPREIYKSGIVL